MKIEKLRINGIRSYLQQSITFEDGVTVIAGPNGSGKSSMLESIFIALYGSNAIVDPGQKIVDLINNDSNHSRAALTFNHLGSEYEISNEYRINSRTGNASNSMSFLKQDGMPVAEQFRNTYEAIKDILKMDEHAFRNCVYIRQGEIDILINASPQERQRMIDDLLQIGRLEEYANRSRSALTSINRMGNNVKSLLDDKKTNLQTLNENDPQLQMNELLTKEKAIKAKIGDINKKKDTVNERIIETDNKIKEYESINSDIQNLVSKNNGLTNLKKDHSGKISQINESIKEKYQKINEKKTEIADLKKDIDIEDIETNIDEVVSDLEAKTNRMSNDVTRIEGDISTKKTISKSINDGFKRNEDTEKKTNENISALNKQIEGDTKDIIDREADITNDQESIQKILDSYKASTIDDFQAIVKKLDIDVQDKLELKTQTEKEVNTIEVDIHGYNIQIETIEESITKENEKKVSDKARLVTVNRDIESTNKKITELKEQCLLVKNEIEAHILKIGRNTPKEITKDYLKEIQKDLNKKQRDLCTSESKYTSNIASINEQIEKDNELCEQGICPTCRQKVDASHIQHGIDERVSKKKEYEAKLIEVRNNLHEIEQHIGEVVTALDVFDNLYTIKSKIETSAQMLDPYGSQKQSIEESIRSIETNIISLNEQKTRLIKDSSIFNEQLQQKKADALNHDKEYQQLKNELTTARNSLASSTSMDGTIKLKKSEIEGLKKNIGKARKDINVFEKDLCDLDKEAKELNSQLNEINADIKELNASLEDANKLYTQTKVVYDSVKKIQKMLRDIADLNNGIQLDNTQIGTHNANIKNCESQILENSERIQKLKQKIGEIDIKSLEDKKDKFEQVWDILVKNLDAVNAENNEVQKNIGTIQEKLKTIKKLDKEITYLDRKLKYLNSIAKDIETLRNTYTIVRSELRSKNINTLNKYINEMFSLMSIDSAYSHILLDNDYNMTVYKKDGNPLDPKQLSGGERAILNIVFRCAIYRLLAVGFGSESSQGLPPIIFDEPTVFLDTDHVRQLIQLLDTMKIIGVGQVIVVSHDETLIDAADQVYRVQKDSSTNISRIYRTSEGNIKRALPSA